MSKNTLQHRAWYHWQCTSWFLRQHQYEGYHSWETEGGGNIYISKWQTGVLGINCQLNGKSSVAKILWITVVEVYPCHVPEEGNPSCPQQSSENKRSWWKQQGAWSQSWVSTGRQWEAGQAPSATCNPQVERSCKNEVTSEEGKLKGWRKAAGVQQIRKPSLVPQCKKVATSNLFRRETCWAIRYESSALRCTSLWTHVLSRQSWKKHLLLIARNTALSSMPLVRSALTAAQVFLPINKCCSLLHQAATLQSFICAPINHSHFPGFILSLSRDRQLLWSLFFLKDVFDCLCMNSLLWGQHCWCFWCSYRKCCHFLER